MNTPLDFDYVRTPHGYPILARKQGEGRDIIVAQRDHTWHPYVVWNQYPDSSCEGGQYFATLTEAVAAYGARNA